MQQVDDISQLQQLIDEMYATADPTFAKRAQEYLHSLQKQPIAWDLAPQLLASSVCAFQYLERDVYLALQNFNVLSL